MANFCSKCGGKVNPSEKFCKSCGANLAGTVETPKPAPMEVPPVQFTPTPVKPAGRRWVYSITNFIGMLIGIGIIILVLYSLGCAMGMFPDTEDRMCQQIQQAFKGSGTTGGGTSGGTSGGGGTKVSIGCQHCSKGYCWTGQTCCPSSAQYYCNGYCYHSSSEAYQAGCHQSSWTRWCCY